MAKFGPYTQPHPPDNQVVAQFLSIAEWPALEAFLYDLMAERKQVGHSYAWFISVALQRLHGIQPALLRARRAQLKQPSPTPTPRGENYPLLDLAALAAKKAF